MRKTDHSGTKHESFTSEEEDLIIKMHAAMGSRLCIYCESLIEFIKDLADSNYFVCVDLDGNLLHNIYQERQKKK